MVRDGAHALMVRSISKESVEELRKKVSKSKSKSKEKMVKVVMIPQSVMLGFNPRGIWPWGFDGCGDGNAKFVMPPGFEYDQKLEETVDELNSAPKVSMALANIVTLIGFGALVGLCMVVTGSLGDSPPLMILAVVGVNFAVIPVVLTGRFHLKDSAVQSYIRRLEDKLPPEKGIVHWEKLEYGRISVWNVPFIGHRTGLTERTAIAVEVFLSNDSLKNLEPDFHAGANVKAGKIYNQNMASAAEGNVEDIVKVQRVTNFLWNIGLGRLSAAIRRNRLTFEKISKLTDQDWREMGIDRTEVKLIKTNVERYLAAEREAADAEERELQMLRDKALKQAEVGKSRAPMLLPPGAREVAMSKFHLDPGARGSIYCYTVSPKKKDDI